MASPVSTSGVPLTHIYSSPESISRKTDEALIKGVLAQFPIENQKYRLEVHNVRAERKEFTTADEKEAILKSKSLTYPVRGDLVLVDKTTGKTVDTEKDFPLADAFALTNKHTMIYSGNNYAVANLLQLKKGVYHRRRDNDEVMAQVNTEAAVSPSVSLDAKKQMLLFSAGGVNVPLAYVLSTFFNVSENVAQHYIPLQVWRQNLSDSAGMEERYLNGLFGKVVPYPIRRANPTPSAADKVRFIKDAIEGMSLDESTTSVTLGKGFSHLGAEALLRTAANLIAIHKGEREEDNRDSLQFKRVANMPDFVARKFREGREADVVNDATRKLRRNLDRMTQAETPRIKGAVPAKPFNKVMQRFITDSTLSFTPSETNPIESLETVGKVTVLGEGEGGIDMQKAKSLKTRNIDPTQLGIIDPSRTPESGSAGVDLRFTINAARDDNGNLYARMVDTKDKVVYLSTREIASSVIGFPNQKGKDPVQAQDKGVLKVVPRSQVQYWIPAATDIFTVTTNLVPFVNSNQAGRLTMAGKAITQALSLEKREKPLVATAQVINGAKVPFTKILGGVASTAAPVAGVVSKVADTHIEVKGEDGKTHRVDCVRNLPFNQKGFLDDGKALVQVGDKVSKGTPLFENNYTVDGELALGRNLTAAYLPYKGFNHEDGLVIREGAAKDLNSLHSYRYDYPMKRESVANKSMFRRWFKDSVTPSQLAMLDERGVVKVGAKLKHGDPVWALLEKRKITATDKMYGRINKQLVCPFRKELEVWSHEEDGEVVDVYSEGKVIRVVVRSIKPLEIGDKLTGLHGNKGVVSLIMPDSQMPYNKETGEPVDIVLNPASVTSRVNLGQVIETAGGRVAQKTGQQYLVTNYEHENNLKALSDDMKKHGVTPHDTLIDPVSGKELPNVFGGPQYFLKLYKTTDSNYSARNVGGYDSWMQPTKGGDEGSKRSAYMEFLGLLGSNARKNLKEMSTVKAEENTEFWQKFMTGQPLPKPKMTFATRKFFDYLRASGIDVRSEADKVALAPMSDHKVLQMSNGEVNKGRFVARTMEPEKGGLFDIPITGGPEGTKWSHYRLAEPIVNPLFEMPVKSMLGLSAGEYDNIVSGAYGVQKNEPGRWTIYDTSSKQKVRDVLSGEGGLQFKKKADEEAYNEDNILVGGHAFHAMLSEMDVEKSLAKAVDGALNAKSISRRDDEVKRAKYLRGLSATGFSNPAEAYILRHMPVIPPVMRPVIDQGGGNFNYADANQLYVDHMALNDPLKEQVEDLPPEYLTKERKALYDGAAAIMGLGEPIGVKKTLKGYIKQIAGDGGPKTGVFHDKLLSRKQDFSGRATIYAAPDVGFNEAKFPVDQLWTLYKFHIIKELMRSGRNQAQALEAWGKRDHYAQVALNKCTKEIPLIINRAPTLMRTNIMAMLPIPVEGKTIGLNPLHLPGFAADYDGDAMTIHVPMTPEAIHEANEKLLPMHHLNDARRGFGVPMFAPGHEAILGSVHLTEPDMNKKVIDFKTENEALEAFKSGRISANQPIRIAA